ncbi:MAG: hypothetical protein LUG61_07820 [Lachnospiraceae bacterium]|nr:hypothetical protein [Lachnospiraceae bacterium]
MKEEMNGNDIRKFQIHRILMNEPLTADILILSAGVEVNLYGGCLPHIGAVSIVDPERNLTTTQFPTHKDGVVSAKWARTIADAGYLPVTVIAGIHYDNLTKEEIAVVVEATDEMLKEALEQLYAHISSKKSE